MSSSLRYCEAILATGTGKILVGSIWGMFASTDLGVTWTRAGLEHETIQRLWSDGNRIFTGTVGGGIFVSTDDGRTWQDENNGISAANIRALAADNQGHVYAVSHLKVHKSNDHGATFAGSFESSASEVTTVSVDSWGRVYAIIMDTIFLSTDYGTTWNVASATGIWQPPWTLGIDPNDNVFTVTRTGAIYKSSNHGQNWTRVYPGGDFASTVNIAFTSDGTGFCATDEGYPARGKVLRSTDNGTTWVEIALGLPTGGVHSLCIDQDGNVFLGTNGSGLYRSTNKGATWTSVNNGLPDLWIQYMVASRSDLLVYTWSYYNPLNWCMYRSTNHGDSWFRESSGLPEDFVTALAASPVGNLYAGTQSYGVFRSERLTDADTPDRAIEYALHQNFPNPFNPKTTIRFALPKTSMVRLDVYNILGQLVSTIVNEVREAGYYNELFDGNNIASGVYFYRLQAGDFIATKRLLLLR